MESIVVPRPMVLVAALALLAPFLAQGASAADGASAYLSVMPAGMEVSPGGHYQVRLYLAHDGTHELALRLAAGTQGQAQVALAQDRVVLPAQGHAEVLVDVAVPPDATFSHEQVWFYAYDESGAMAPLSGLLDLWTSTNPTPPTAYEPPTLELQRGETRTMPYGLSNPSSETLTFDVRVEVPAGWTGTPQPARVEIAPGGHANVDIIFHAGQDAVDGPARIVATSAHGEERFEFDARVVEPPESPPPTTEPTPTDPESPPTALDPGPVEPVAPEEQLPPAVPGPEAFLPPRVEVEGSPVRVQPGGSATFTLLVTSQKPLPVEAVGLLAPRGFRAMLDDAPREIPAGEDVRVRVRVEAPEDARVGQRMVGAAEVLGTKTEWHVLVIAPPSEPQALDAQADHAIVHESTWVMAAAAAGVGGAALAGAWGRRRWALLLAPLYTRLAPSRLLDHDVRQRIVDLVREEPGITYGQLQERLGVASGVLTHHTRMLEQARMLFSSPDGQLRRFYLSGATRVEPRADLATRALETLEAEGPMSMSELARRLGVSRQSLHYHVQRMLKEGRLRADGRALAVAAPLTP